MTLTQFLIAVALWCSGGTVDSKSQCQQRLLNCYTQLAAYADVVACFKQNGKL